jgi:RNA recognition motif-containing protein
LIFCVSFVNFVVFRCGEVVDCLMGRDKFTGKPKGYAFIAFEDQRSTVLAVDNFNGSKVRFWFGSYFVFDLFLVAERKNALGESLLFQCQEEKEIQI